MSSPIMTEYDEKPKGPADEEIEMEANDAENEPVETMVTSAKRSVLIQQAQEKT